MTGLLHIRAILLLLLICWVPAGLSQTDFEPDIDSQLSQFDADLGKFENSFSSQEALSLEQLKAIQLDITEIRSFASKCASDLKTQLDQIDSNFEIIGEVISHEDRVVAAERKSLSKVKQKIESQLAACKVIQLRSNQISETAIQRQQALVATKLLTKNRSFLDHIREIIVNPGTGFYSIIEFAVSKFGLELIYEHRYLLILCVAISIPVALFFRWLLSLFINRYRSRFHTSFARKLAMAIVTCSRHYLLMLLITGSFGGFFLYLGMTLERFPFSSLLSIGLFLYVLLTWLLRIIFSPVKPALPLLGIQQSVAEKLMRRLRLLAKLLFLGFLIFSATNLHDFPQPVTGILRNLYVSLLVLNLCWAFWLLGNIKGLANTRLLRGAIILALITSILAEWSGYTNLSRFILVGITGSFAIWIFTHLVIKLWTEFLDSFDDGEFAWQRYIRNKLGIKPDEFIPGSFGLRITFNFVVWSLFAIALLKIWGLSDASLIAIQSLVTDGFSIGPVQVVPSRLIFAVLLFVLLLSILSWVKRGLQQSWLNRSRLDRRSKESMITLTGYVGVVIAFVIALSMAGVELSNLALIAGALSVGIGFGLQNVVNNFVSGIVLLFERPIKTGDWIIVGGTQGYVRKIQLRSTLMETFDRADVIVPNSEIISSQVTNLMLHDNIGRIKVPIRAAYGSDPRQVEKILLDIANAHPKVITRSQTVDAPWVLFIGFGDYAMQFELRCFISEIDDCLGVASDINYAIVDAFRTAGIEIPFPQSDLHLKSDKTQIFNSSK